MDTRVDVTPFAARIIDDQPGEYSIWWDDPRDVQSVEVTFTRPVAEGQVPELLYWQHSWPRVRVPRNAVVGAGEQGWLAMDDWITGQWQRAAVRVDGRGREWHYTFLPLDREDLPHAAEFPVRFRRTLKLCLRARGDMPAVESVRALTDSEWREVQVCIEWGGTASSEQCWDGRLEAYNGYVLGVEVLGGDCHL
ncbi:MAG: hypothetical protein QME94_11240, partial [Anaerolineae bacterium]|nr:hypothetical protein [Anaerolineae bacterium]